MFFLKKSMSCFVFKGGGMMVFPLPALKLNPPLRYQIRKLLYSIHHLSIGALMCHDG